MIEKSKSKKFRNHGVLVKFAKKETRFESWSYLLLD